MLPRNDSYWWERLCSRNLSADESRIKGYVFENSSSISPHLEQPRIGPTSRFCAELAERLECYVIAGYPERLHPDDIQQEGNEDDSDDPTPKIGANSAVLCGPNGEWVGGYRKTHLFETDKTWAKPGTWRPLLIWRFEFDEDFSFCFS